MRHARNVVSALFATLLSVSAHANVVHEYTVAIDATLDTMRVEARFGTRVENIRARSRDANRFIGNIRDCDSDERLQSNGRRLDIPRTGVSCLSYVVDLGRAAAALSRP